MLKLGEIITTTCRDVCALGFEGQDAGSIDAVFLDLPEPWRVIEDCARVLRPGRHLCSYSPCIEQVVKTCDALRAHGFHSIKMVEVRLRPSQSKMIALESADMGDGDDVEAAESYFAVAPTAVADRKRQIEKAHEAADAREANGLVRNMNKNDTDEAPGKGGHFSSKDIAEDDKESSVEPETKRPRRSDNLSNTLSACPTQLPPVNTLVNQTSFLMKGHTAFLTFAVQPL
jgi:hypothetical protein